MNSDLSELKDFLDYKFEQYHQEEFIKNDPIQIPHLFSVKEDIEIAAFLSATIAWGQRCTIIKNAHKLIQYMDRTPHDFIMNANHQDLIIFKSFVHRTFNGEDCFYFIKSLQHIYQDLGGLENLFSGKDIPAALANFKSTFFMLNHPKRTEKHLSSPLNKSACKRLNMFLRWMVRKDKSGIDFGIWKNLKTSQLYIPLDIHVGNTARTLGLLERKQNDWQAVVELTEILRKFDPLDPIKYDYALFGLGVEKFNQIGR